MNLHSKIEELTHELNRKGEVIENLYVKNETQAKIIESQQADIRWLRSRLLNYEKIMNQFKELLK